MSEVNHELFRKYMEESNKLQQELIAELGEEEYWAREHWVNNPLIKPRSKVAMFEEAIARAEKETEQRIVELLEAEREKHIPWCGDVQPCPECYKTMGLETALALIKGEDKTNPWTSRPLNEEDNEHYGQEGENK